MLPQPMILESQNATEIPHLCIGSERVSSNSESFAPKTKLRPKFGMRFSPPEFDCQNLHQNPIYRFSRTMPADASWTGDEFRRRFGVRGPVIFDTKSRWRMSHVLVPDHRPLRRNDRASSSHLLSPPRVDRRQRLGEGRAS